MDAGFLKGRERMVFALIAGMLFMILKAVFPDMPFSEEHSMAFFGILGAYILGEGISQAQIGQNLMEVFKSQKFQALAVGLLLVLIKGFYPEFSLDEKQVLEAVALLGTFIIGAGVRS